MNQVKVTKSDVAELKRLYKKAISDGKDQFVFKGFDVLVSYAKYLIEYLDSNGTMTRAVGDDQ